jgi:predicted phage terminase large subunit-like protein
MKIEGYDPDDLDALPRDLRMYGASDYATMEAKKGKKEPDFTEHGVWGMDTMGDLWAVDWWSKQCETDKAIEAFIGFVRQYKPVKWWNEGSLIDKAIGPAIRRAMREARKYTVVEPLSSILDKGAKLQSFHARTTAGTVHFPVKRAWAERVIDQLVKFPAGRWDDAADVCGLIGRGIDQMLDAQLPPKSERPILVPFTEAWLTYNDRPNKPKVRYFT